MQKMKDEAMQPHTEQSDGGRGVCMVTEEEVEESTGRDGGGSNQRLTGK